MAHFAKIENETVIAVHVIANDEIVDEDGVEQESLGVARCNELIGEATWVQTSYNNNFRKNYAGKGFTYDQTRDAFIEPKPYPSWLLDESTCRWNAPTAYPDDDKRYDWNEDSTSWEEVV
jgi:hypothetical protein